MDAIAFTTRYLLLPVYYAWTGSTVLRDHRRFMKTQYLSADEIAAAQWRALERMVAHAYEHNRFYRRRFDDLGVAPADLRSFSDFARLPPVTKDDLRSHREELLSSGIDPTKLLHKRTGGSTGIPVHLEWDCAAVQTKSAMTMRHDEWAHHTVAAKKAALWGDVEPRETLWRKMTGVLHDRTVYLDTLKMDERAMLAFVADIRRTGARLLFGHGHSLFFFAKFLKDHGIWDIELDGIISTAEMLPPEERRVVEDVFGNVVFDRYGCEEVGLIASECEAHQGMHIAAEGVYVEVVDGSESEPGKVLVTDLLNRATPLLRYDIGDLATTVSGPCPCGRGLPRLGRITGRTSDVLYTPEGRQVSGISLLDTVTIHIPGFKQVQVVQDRIDELQFTIVKGDGFSPASLATLAAAVTKYFGPRMRHTVAFADTIPLTGRGKYQFSICRLTPDDVGRVRSAC